jgi:hypothetical protein
MGYGRGRKRGAAQTQSPGTAVAADTNWGHGLGRGSAEAHSRHQLSVTYSENERRKDILEWKKSLLDLLSFQPGGPWARCLTDTNFCFLICAMHIFSPTSWGLGHALGTQ